MIGPMRVDKSWQAQDPEAFELAQFTIDWDAEQVTCPQGKKSYKWSRGKGLNPRDRVESQRSRLTSANKTAAHVKSGRVARGAKTTHAG